MILPIIRQECLVMYRNQLHLAVVARAYVNHLGQWRIAVYSPAWSYDIDYKPQEVELLPVTRSNGVKYDAVTAFNQNFSAEQIDALIEAETTPRGMSHHPANNIPKMPRSTGGMRDPNPQSIPKRVVRVSQELPNRQEIPKPDTPINRIARISREFRK